jgi:hypothetical protein
MTHATWTRCAILAVGMMLAASERAAAQQPMFVRSGETVPSPLPGRPIVGDFTDDGLTDFWGAQTCVAVGSGRYEIAGPGPFFGGAQHHVAVADFTGDGHLDVIQMFQTPSSPTTPPLLQYVYVGGGATAPQNALPSQAYPQQYGSISAGDVDGDGDPDLIVHLALPPSLAYINNGLGAFTPQNGWYGLNLASTSRLSAHDLDGDGTVDVVGESAAAGPYTYSPPLPSSIYVQRNFGNGAFDVPVTLTPAGAAAILPAAIGDVDGDGRKDVLFTYRLQGVAYAAIARLLPTTTWFTFAPLVSWPIMSPEPYLGDFATSACPKALIDLDQDGDAEIVLSTEAGVEIRDFVGGTVTAPTAVLPLWPETFVPVQADEDGRTDLAAVWRGTEIVILINDGLGSLVPIRGASDIRRNLANRAVLFDAESDGDKDLVAYVATDAGVAPAISVNNGSGVFTWAPPAPCPGCPRVSTNSSGFPGTVLDADADGDVDLFLYADTLPPDQSVYLRNDGVAGFAVGFTTIAAFQGRAVTADFNSDGFADVATGSGAGVSILFGGSTGLGPPSTVLGQGGWDLWAIDIDLDGDTDLVRTSTSFPYFLIAGINDGNGQFTPTPLPTTVQNYAFVQVSAGDFDGDGLSDLFAGGGWLRRTGPLTFVNQGTFFGAFNTTHVSGDFDLDGDLDVLVDSISLSSPHTLYLNSGTGTFVTAPSAALANLLNDVSLGFPFEFDAADVDGDGDLDVADRRGAVYLNATRQLAGGRPPRPDRPFDVRLYGRPNASWIVATALDVLPAPIPFAPFGRLELDPSTAVLVASGSLDANGRAELTGFLDTATATFLAGVPFIAQAVVDESGLPRLTNGLRYAVALY